MEEVCMEDPDSISEVEITDLKGYTNQSKENMLTRLSQTDAHFKHQQRGEADLTCDEKREIARNILEKSSSIFLARFGAYLSSDDLEHFVDKSGDYEIQFYLQQLKKEKSKDYSANRVKNRRYQAMKQLIQEGEYFSDDSIKHRDPYLYEQLIGQYLTQEEIQGLVDKADLRFSTILLKHMDQLEENQVFKFQKDKEDCQFEEEDEDSEEEEEMEKDEEEISDERKSEMREELYRIMQERFLSGKEQQFDYSQVDDNTAYDDLDLLDKDEEEKYFDSEEPVEMSVPKLTDLANSMLINNDTAQINGSEKPDVGGQDTSITNTCGSGTEPMKTDIQDNSSEGNVT
ncbi:coiled-coil domain-containing protein 97-like [Mizuhopecten yessoensis]|uniref:Coiled-coil domain-containing protein 97 n=1 Tax=Mizuhopecten yessoensis TaxID=6573 RepID=A0A210PKR9_MIZYE|nr:coiled-coil domain-containing protein 97-like [Mizuhopecten yessoensis]OWF37077.1 Coiled-coil domain-containing protein 97 [Mizuhopecten yessoensis]